MTDRIASQTEEMNIEELMAKYDRESDFRRLTGFIARVVAAIAVTFSVFQLYTANFGTFDAHIQRAIHLSFAMALVYLLYPTRRSWPRNRLHWFDAVLAVLAAATPVYIVSFYQELVMRAGIMTPADILAGTLGVFFVLEAARRVVGWPIVIVASIFLGYAFAGPYIPGIFAHQGVDLEHLVGHLYFTTEGVLPSTRR